MSMRFLKARQTRYALYVTMYIVIILAIVTVANILGDRYNKSYDGTANKRYSLSDQTLKILHGLKHDATITYFDQSTRFQHAKDLLDEYANASLRVHIQYVDPDKQPQLAREANIKDYGTAIVKVGMKQEPAQSVTEEGLTGAFIRDLKDKTRTVCFVSGSGEHQIDDTSRDGYSRFKQLLGQDEYETKSINLLQTAQVPSDCTVLVAGGPRTDYQQPEIDAIKKYVENGGRALFLLNPPLNIGHDQIAPNTALNSLLEGWGVTPDNDLILDLNPIGQLAGLGPQVALVTSYDSHPIVSEMKGSATGFPITRSLELQSSGKSSVQALLSSSNTSLATSNLKSAAISVRDPDSKKGPLTIAAAGTYHTGNPNSPGRFVVFGSSDWLANSFINFNGNSDLAVNSVNWLSSDEDLISIRPRKPENQRITMTRAQMTLVRSTSQFVFPLVVVFAGIGVWRRRR